MKKLSAVFLSAALTLSLCILPALAAEQPISWYTKPVYRYESITPVYAQNYKDLWVIVAEGDSDSSDEGLMRSNGAIVLNPVHNFYNWDEGLYRQGTGSDYLSYLLDENGKDGKAEEIGLGGPGDYDHYYELSSKTLYYGSPLTDDLKKISAGPNDIYTATVVDKFVKETRGDYEELDYEDLGRGIYAKGGLSSGTNYAHDESYAIAYHDPNNVENSLFLAKNAQDKWGYVKYDLSVVYPYVFDEATPFASVHKLAAVEQNDLWGFVNLPGVTNAPAGPATATAKPTASRVMVDTVAKSFDAYNIADHNYFKLRDLALVLSGSEKQFEVSFDAGKNAINLVSKKAYTPVGGEMTAGDGAEKPALLSSSKIYLDGKEVSLSAYNIKDNNYFKLRDVCKLLNVGVTFDSATNTIGIDAKIGYTD